MSKFSLLTQIAMAVVAITIGIMYIKPTISEIRVIESTTDTYQAEIAKVSFVNETLKQKLAEIEAINPADVASLVRYIPDRIDEVAVMKDIVAMFAIADVELTQIKYTKAASVSAAVEGAPVDPYVGLAQYGFTASADMNSKQLLKILDAMEVNNYLLQISALKIDPKTDGTLAVEMNLTAFSRALPVVEPQ